MNWAIIIPQVVVGTLLIKDMDILETIGLTSIKKVTKRWRTIF